MGGVVESVKDFGQGAIDVARGAGGVVVDVVKGDSTKDSLAKLGGGTSGLINSQFELAMGGKDGAALLNKYSGGKLDQITSANNTVGNLIQGKSVTKNIKDVASLGLQAAGTYVGQAGLNVGGQDLTGFAQNILGGLNARLGEGGSSGGASPNPVNYVNPSQASYNGSVATVNYLPYILIGAVVLVGAIVLLKKKK